ncbi:FMN-binding negative transcriptional regulator [Hyphomonas pacifica]|uniref:Transcriptional regulator n=2 Tax=Hyphomonas pacifica TaxID=1280941 RepID=A0A062U4F2_9PROT|nr:FMN-binding negative transcriptional regulator [Hyphomonas pacifica]KCZ51514.1 hypothetical protein HY2_10925 [Hyphomonas pacifica]RAN34146.1 hypothetical protein HY3_11315 [Hyphomonas pacifica]
MTVSPARPIGTDAMHPSRVFHEHDRALLLETARQNAFALIISSLNNRPIAAHAPVLLDEAGADIHLRFHLANANPATEALKQTGQTLVVFTGPHAYVSPDWYGQPDQVGTWNYISVEAEGPVTPLTADATPRLLDDLSAVYEGKLAPKPAWTRDKMDPAKFTRMLTAITGFQLTPTRFEGIRKLNQNKPEAARAGVISALNEQADPLGLAIADEMHKLKP